MPRFSRHFHLITDTSEHYRLMLRFFLLLKESALPLDADTLPLLLTPLRHAFSPRYMFASFSRVIYATLMMPFRRR